MAIPKDSKFLNPIELQTDISDGIETIAPHATIAALQDLPIGQNVVTDLTAFFNTLPQTPISELTLSKLAEQDQQVATGLVAHALLGSGDKLVESDADMHDRTSRLVYVAVTSQPMYTKSRIGLAKHLITNYEQSLARDPAPSPAKLRAALDAKGREFIEKLSHAKWEKRQTTYAALLSLLMPVVTLTVAGVAREPVSVGISIFAEINAIGFYARKLSPDLSKAQATIETTAFKQRQLKNLELSAPIVPLIIASLLINDNSPAR